MHSAARIPCVPGVVFQPRLVVAVTILSPGSPSPATILPFRLRGQAIGLPFLFAQPFAEIDGILPRHIVHGMIALSPGFQLLPAVITHAVVILLDESSELPDRDFRGTHVERLRDLHRMIWAFGRQAIFPPVVTSQLELMIDLFLARPHRELACRDE